MASVVLLFYCNKSRYLCILATINTRLQIKTMRESVCVEDEPSVAGLRLSEHSIIITTYLHTAPRASCLIFTSESPFSPPKRWLYDAQDSVCFSHDSSSKKTSLLYFFLKDG